MGLVSLPWIGVVFFTAGTWAALNFLGYAIVVLATGYCVVSATLPSSLRAQAIAFCPGVGVMVISALTAFWVRLGLPLIWAPAFWLGLTAVGLLMFWRDRRAWTTNSLPRGLALILLSVLICMVYFLPSACNDLVERHDGSFNWMYIDSQHFHAIAASIKSGGSPPKTPGTFTAELLYHFGPEAPSAAISRLDKLDLGDALARVTRGASLWALMLSCFGLGSLLSLRANGSEFGGIMSVAGLFFYGSLSSLFTEETTILGHVAKAVLFKIPGAEVLANGGPFDQLIGGGSMLYGLGVITVILGLCLFERERESGPAWREVALVILPSLAVPMNSLAALYCLGAAGILLFWARLRSARSWLLILLMVCLFFVAWKIMGYGQSTDASHAIFKQHVALQWWTITLWFLVGLGFRIVGFRWISRPLKDPLSALVLATFVGFLAFSLLIHLRDYNERYGLYFLQSLLSIFAFSRLKSEWWLGGERSEMVVDWLKMAKRGMIALGACGVLISIASYIARSHTGIQNFRVKIIIAFLLFALFVFISAQMTRSLRVSKLGSAVLMAVLLIGFLAWTPDWIRFGLGEVKVNTTYAPGEVRGLRRLGELMAPSDRFATNKHALDGYGPLPLDRSYGYSALSEHPVLLEGYLDRGETFLPWFSRLLHDNDLMFSTTDPEELREIAKNWDVQWLVARPGTDISSRDHCRRGLFRNKTVAI